MDHASELKEPDAEVDMFGLGVGIEGLNTARQHGRRSHIRGASGANTATHFEAYVVRRPHNSPLRQVDQAPGVFWARALLVASMGLPASYNIAKLAAVAVDPSIPHITKLVVKMSSPTSGWGIGRPCERPCEVLHELAQELFPVVGGGSLSTSMLQFRVGA